MALGVIDFYSPVAKGFAAGFFCGDFGGNVRYFDWFDPFDDAQDRLAHHKEKRSRPPPERPRDIQQNR
jgi:hypothetical protein